MDICSDDLLFELIKITSEIRINTNWILLPEFVRFKIFLDFLLFLYCLQDIYTFWVNKIFQKINTITYSKETTWKYVRNDQSSH